MKLPYVLALFGALLFFAVVASADSDNDWHTTTEECRTTTEPCRTTTEECRTTTEPCRTTTEKPPCQTEECDWNKLEKCRETNIKKFDRCLYRKRWNFVDCNEEAEKKFKHCLRSDFFGFDLPWDEGLEESSIGKRDLSEPHPDDSWHQAKWEHCKKEFDEDKEKCLVIRKAEHAACWEARECREYKCLRFIKDCKPCPKPTTTTTTTTTTTSAPPLSSGCPATDYFGAAADFNAIIFGSDELLYDFNLSSGDIEGRVAVNGGLQVSSFGTAQTYYCPDNAQEAKQYNLIVNGKMQYNSGQLFCGSSICLSSGNNPSLRQQPYGAVNTLALSSSDLSSKSGFDFSSTIGYLQGVSNYFCQYQPGLHSPLNVAQYSPSQVSSITIPNDGYVSLINIKGTGDINFSNFQISTTKDPSQIIFNVCGDNDVLISGFELNGHLLALTSDVVLENGHIQGNVYSQSLVGSGSGQVNLAPCPST